MFQPSVPTQSPDGNTFHSLSVSDASTSGSRGFSVEAHHEHQSPKSQVFGSKPLFGSRFYPRGESPSRRAFVRFWREVYPHHSTPSSFKVAPPESVAA